ncbi:DUF1173 domain-containing protein [Burkholderia sp. HI2500]|uniref:DUF1173 domain-containing protein n=1 Tax=Burkholderia sp. HI2500 TaxID=2015358 RepID=UPI000B79D474|nr:DUF1173 domain-containing protein [Burkholderia sp. HI2500]OXJ06724.1 hypothetical protein CFB45_37950 [Burkholderia sp. HI2500]
MHAYRFGTALISADADDLQRHLAAAYKGKQRPLCACLPDGVPMYIAKLDAHYVIKRMPDSGAKHAPECPSYEPPAELSGRAAVLGQAVQDDGEATNLRLDFSLTKSSGKSAPESSGRESDSVRTDGAKLTLRGLLHYLWDEAGLNRWSPAMENKRSWALVRRELLSAVLGKTAKKAPLGEQLFIPETWSLDRDAELTARRITAMAPLAKVGKTRPMMIAIGEVKEILPTRSGAKLVAKHLANFPFMLDEDLHRRFMKRFANAIALWDGVEGAHLIFIATFGLESTGLATVSTLSAMVVTDRWIPFEDMYDKVLIDAMTSDRRRFVKGLRYNLAENQTLACAVLTDTDVPTALYVLTPGSPPEAGEALEAVIAESAVPAWVWDADEPMQLLPSAKGAIRSLPAPGPESIANSTGATA